MANGDFYGTTAMGGAHNAGTIFKITPSGTLTTLYSFCSQEIQSNCTDGNQPEAALIQSADGALYGTTYNGGSNGSYGTIFKITEGGTLTTLHSFCSESGCTDGDQPFGSLVQATDGNLYGTTAYGGSRANAGCTDLGCGTIFKITSSGKLTTLYSFCSLSACLDGALPFAGLIKAADGYFYGTTEYGGASRFGTVFKITPSGALTTIFDFCSLSGCRDGAGPAGQLIQASDGNIYGTTPNGGGNGFGTAFKITPSGALTTLYNFCAQSGCADGRNPVSGLLQATNGILYGTTYAGGDSGACGPRLQGCGTIFNLTVGLGPFVEMRNTLGEVGASVQVLTGSGTLSSNVPRVLP